MPGVFVRVTIVLGCLVAGLALAQSDTALREDAVVASRGDAEVTIGDLRAKVRQAVSKPGRRGYFTDGDRVARLVEDQLLSRQLVGVAKESGLAASPELQAEIDAYVVGVIARAQIEQYLDGLDYPDADLLARERYLADKATYVVPESRDVRHILIGAESKNDDDASAKAQTAWEALQQGQAFDKVLDEFTEDPAVSHNGWVRDVTEGGAFDEAFTAAAFALAAPGDYSRPVKSLFGYHIIRLERVAPARQKPYEEVRDELIAGIRSDQRNAAREAYLDTFRTQETHLNEDVLKLLPNVTP